MALDRQIGERRHVITKEKDLRTGHIEENNDYDNLSEGRLSNIFFLIDLHDYT